MTRMGDGTVLPSNFIPGSTPGAKSFLTSNFALRAGMVTKITYPEDPSSVSGQVIEYDVAIFQADVKNGVNVSTIRSCKSNNMFGSANNNVTYTLLPSDKDSSSIYSKGSLVLLLCINGLSDAGSAVIVGGLANSDGPTYSKDDGQFYDFNFNGINYNINKDGEWTVTFNSPFDSDGNHTNKDAKGTEIKIDKDGRVKISDNEGQSWQLDRVAKTSTWSNGAESITIDKGNKKISLTSSGELDAHSDKATAIDSGDALNITSKADASLSSQAAVSIESKGNSSVNSGGTWQVQSTGDATIQAGGNVLVQGGNIAQINGDITLVGEGSVPVAAVGISMCLGVGNLGLPVVSNIITGSSTVFVGT